MSPSSAMYHLPHMAGGNAKLFCDGSRFHSRCAQLPYARNIRPAKAPVHFAFLHRIKSIVNLGAEKKMVWPDTQPIITLVKDMHRTWNFPIVNRPGKPMGRK